MNNRRNTLEAIRYGNPDFVPIFDGTVWEAVQLGGNFKFESWTDHWGTVWEMTEGDFAPVDVGHREVRPRRDRQHSHCVSCAEGD